MSTFSTRDMPYRPEAELKRPDLKGEFLCGHCGKTFCHAASLNRHRLNFHGDDQQCKLCDAKIAAHETVRRHMNVHHQISRVFTCGCCNWTFPDKKELHAHNNSMLRTGQPGDARAIAVSNRVPGSLAQAELRDPGHVSPPVKSSSPAPKKRKVDGNGVAQNFYNQMMSGMQQQTPINVNEWLQQFLLNNPAFLPMLGSLQQQSAAVKQEEPSTSFDLSKVMVNSEKVEVNVRPSSADLPIKTESPSVKSEPALSISVDPQNVDAKPLALENKKFSPLVVKTETDGMCSGPESGIASGEDATTDASPIPSESSKEGSPPMIDALGNKQSRKRKSVDAIASFLYKQKQCAALQG